MTPNNPMTEGEALAVDVRQELDRKFLDVWQDSTDYYAMSKAGAKFIWDSAVRAALSAASEGAAIAPEEVHVRIAGRYVLCDLQETTFDDLALYHARESAAHTAASGGEVWRCFHCDEAFTDQESAAEHFGTKLRHDPACTIDPAEFRRLQDRETDYAEQDAAIHRQMARMETEHRTALEREEIKGYERGLRDSGKCPCAAPPAAVPADALMELVSQMQERAEDLKSSGGAFGPDEVLEWADELAALIPKGADHEQR